jgi:hypothetical protein
MGQVALAFGLRTQLQLFQYRDALRISAHQQVRYGGRRRPGSTSRRVRRGLPDWGCRATRSELLPMTPGAFRYLMTQIIFPDSTCRPSQRMFGPEVSALQIHMPRPAGWTGQANRLSARCVVWSWQGDKDRPALGGATV